MTFGYSKPFIITITPSPVVNVVSVRHGVTEITLSDGRLVRATLHVKEVKINSQKLGDVDVSYSIAAEVMPTPTVPILEVHETIQ
jgi:hypothetical protein